MIKNLRKNNDKNKPLIPPRIKRLFVLRKEILITFSLCISILNSAFLIEDLVLVENTGKFFTRGDFYATTVHSLSIAIVSGMLSFVYSVLMKKKVFKILSITAIVTNMVLFLLRLLFEVSYSGYRPTSRISQTTLQ